VVRAVPFVCVFFASVNNTPAGCIFAVAPFVGRRLAAKKRSIAKRKRCLLPSQKKPFFRSSVFLAAGAG
jgi:hypothetical protein